MDLQCAGDRGMQAHQVSRGASTVRSAISLRNTCEAEHRSQRGRNIP